MAKTSGPVTPSAGSFLTSLPSVMEAAQFVGNIANQITAFEVAGAETTRKNAVARTQYWQKYGATSRQNYRDYEKQLRSWYRDASYVEEMRQYQQQLAEQRAEFKGEIAAAATQQFGKRMAELEARFYEEEAKEEIEMQNLQLQSFAKASRKVASGQVGRTVTALQNQYNQQYLSNLSNRQITRKFRIADKLVAGEAADVARQNQTSQVQYYTPQPIADPIKPMAPLPIEAVPPTPEQGPSKSAFVIGLAETALDTAMAYKDMLPDSPERTKQTNPNA
jgi:hypothetical protein